MIVINTRILQYFFVWNGDWYNIVIYPTELPVVPLLLLFIGFKCLKLNGQGYIHVKAIFFTNWFVV